MTPYRNTREALDRYDGRWKNVFPNEPVATSSKRHQDGSMQYIDRWIRSCAERTGGNIETTRKNADVCRSFLIR